MSPSRAEDLERVWRELRDYAPEMSEQGREYLDLATRLVRANRALMDLPDLEQEAYEEIQSISMLLHSVGEPDDPHLYRLIDLITHLLDRLYVRIEYTRWAVSPLTTLSESLPTPDDVEGWSPGDRAALAFVRSYDAAVRSGNGLADPEIRDVLRRRLSALPLRTRADSERRLWAAVDLISRLLAYYDEPDSFDED